MSEGNFTTNLIHRLLTNNHPLSSHATGVDLFFSSLNTINASSSRPPQLAIRHHAFDKTESIFSTMLLVFEIQVVFL